MWLKDRKKLGFWPQVQFKLDSVFLFLFFQVLSLPWHSLVILEAAQLEKINRAKGDAEALLTVAKARATGLDAVADSLNKSVSFEFYVMSVGLI